MNNKVTVTGANIVFFTFTVAFFVFQFILGLVSGIYGEGFINNNVYGIILVNEYVIILIPIIIYAIVKKLNVKEVFKLNRLKILPAILIVLISVPAYFVAAMMNTIVVYFLQFIIDIPSQPIPIPNNVAELIIGLLVVSVSPAICEEVLHRGILLSAYERRGTMKAVVITAIFFGVFHFDITNLAGPILLGVIIGYFVIRTRSIYAGMLAHFLNNTIAELIQFFSGKSEATSGKITVSLLELGSITIYGIIALILVLLFIKIYNYITEGCLYNPPIANIKNDVISVISHWSILAIFSLYIVTVCVFIFAKA